MIYDFIYCAVAWEVFFPLIKIKGRLLGFFLAVFV